nr:zinc finger BED domain-containing protein RICESLEEPER 2-like [Ipomoea trifida]
MVVDLEVDITCGIASKDVSDEIVTPVEKSELDRYLEQPCYEMKFYQDLDVLDYWKGLVQGYLILSCMSRDLLAIPITTVASESAFSIGARVLTKYENIEVVCCLEKCKL